MKNISVFQLIFLSVFFLFMLGGFAVVTIYSHKSSGRGQQENITMWGPFNSSQMRPILNSVEATLQKTEPGLKIHYVQKNQDTFDYDLVESIANGVNPDLVVISQESFIPNSSRLYPIPFQSYPARQFKDSFVEEGELFLAGTVIGALPFAIDPLVLYWNRDLFSAKGISQPPQNWDEMYSLAQKLTTRDSGGTITQSGIALGEYSNVVHAKDIISALYLQTGDPMTTWKPKYNGVYVIWGNSGGDSASPVNFYTQFSNPTKPVYSWNRSLPDSKSMFIAGRLGMYIGFASELAELKAKAPNLNFDVTYFPQAAGGTPTTFANIYGISLLRTSRNLTAAFNIANALTSQNSIALWSSTSKTPPVRRDVGVSSGDQNQAIFSKSALFSRGWLDPNHIASGAVFKEMIESVTSGADTPTGAVSRAEVNLKTYAQ